MLDAQAMRTRILRAVKDARAAGDEPAAALNLLLRRLDSLADDLAKGLFDLEAEEPQA